MPTGGHIGLHSPRPHTHSSRDSSVWSLNPGLHRGCREPDRWSKDCHHVLREGSSLQQSQPPLQMPANCGGSMAGRQEREVKHQTMQSDPTGCLSARQTDPLGSHSRMKQGPTS